MKRIIHLLSFLFLWTSVACSEFAEEAQPYEPEVAEKATGTPKTRTGVVYEKMANPYSLENMQAVYDSLYVPTPGQLPPPPLEATDLYVRIMPQDSTQLNWLIFESGLELFDYPLDIKLEEGAYCYLA